MARRSILVLLAHPYPRHSRAGRALLASVQDIPKLSVRSLYDRYPDFAIDVEAEQSALREADLVVWQCPIYWYGVPALLHLWFEKILQDGFAYGPGGDALSGKPLLWVTTTGTSRATYSPTGMHQHPLEAFVHPIEQTARFCGMRWEEPIVVYSSHEIDDAALAAHAEAYRSRLQSLSLVEDPADE